VASLLNGQPNNSKRKETIGASILTHVPPLSRFRCNRRKRFKVSPGLSLPFSLSLSPVPVYFLGVIEGEGTVIRYYHSLSLHMFLEIQRKVEEID
jgi:hypothetical protein